jgi:hypothetical protein
MDNKTQLIKRIPIYVWLLVSVGSVLVLILVLFANLGFVWHLIYGDAAAFNGRNILIPEKFYIDSSSENPDSLTMWKTDLGIPIWDAPYGQITVFKWPHPFIFDEHHIGFRSGVSLDAQDRGFDISEVGDPPAATGEPYCLEGTDKESSASILVRCAIQNDDIVFFYSGHPKYLPSFYEALQGTTAWNDVDK